MSNAFPVRAARGRHGLRVSALAVAIATLLATAGAADGATRPGWRVPRLAWTGCHGAPQVQCSTLWVPLDWSHPDGVEIRLALTRLRATGPGRRIGTVLFNCGGPGCPSAQALKSAPGIFTAALRRRFDIVAFDPATPARAPR